jgi:putative sigma-54 modulation protein
MQIHFTGRNIDVTPAIKTFTEEKMAHLADRQNISKINVTLHVENVTHIAEATAHFSGTDLHASAKADNMYAAIEMLADKLTAQVNKHKEKLTDRHRE